MANRLLLYGLSLLLQFIFILLIMKSRYKKFTIKDFVLFYRKGRLRSSGYGGSYFRLPLLDEIIVLPTAIQNINIDIMINEHLGKRSQTHFMGHLFYKIKDPKVTYQTIPSDNRDFVTNMNEIIEKLVSSIIKQTISKSFSSSLKDNITSFTDKIQKSIDENLQSLGLEVHKLELDT